MTLGNLQFVINKILTPSNFILGILFGLVLLNCAFSLQSSSYNSLLANNLDPSFAGEIRILQEDKQKFGNRYQAQSEIGSIFVEPKSKLKIGYRYYVQGQMTRFNLDNKENQSQDKSKNLTEPTNDLDNSPNDNTNNNVDSNSNLGKIGFAPQVLSNLATETHSKILESPIITNQEITDPETKPKINFDSYYISTGKVGRIKNPTTIQELAGCDWECVLYQKIAGFRSNMAYYYDQQICKNLDWINQFFGNNCIQPLAWANGLVIGNGDLFEKPTKDNIKKLGLTHLIVVSGTQVSLIFVALEVLLLQCNLSRKRRWIMCILGILLLIFVVGLQAPVLRSSISIFLSTMSLIVLGRRLNPFRSLGYSAVLLLIFNPFFIISYSFWLSFIATFGLIMATSLSRQITTIPEIDFLTSYKDIALTTIGTFCYTLPLIVNLSGGISPIAIVSNLIVLPVINIITILNILGFVPVVGELFLIVATFAQNILISLLNELVKYAFVLPVESFGLIEIAIYWIILTVLIALIARYRYFRTDKYHDLQG